MMVADSGVRSRLCEITLLTVTVQVAVLLPSSEVAVIVALPAALAVTSPLASTVATEVLLLVQFTFLLVALLGATVAVKVSEAPTFNASELLLSETPVTGM